MPDLSTFQPTQNAADTFDADIVLHDGATGAELTVTATLRPRGLTPRTQNRLFKIATHAKIAEASGTELDPAIVDDIDDATTAALAELVAVWDVAWEGADVDPADSSVLPLAIRSALLQGAQEAIQQAPLEGAKPSAAPTNTARKPHRKS